MEYSIFYLIKGKAKNYHQKLVKEVGPKFGENYLIQKPLPSHVCLKSPFKTRDMHEVEDLLEKFVKKQKPAKIIMLDFGNFRRFVAFSKISFSKKAFKIQKDLIKELKTIKGINLHKFDKNFKPHATIAYGNTKKSFNKIWDYLKTKEKPKFNLEFDNIAILKKQRKYWKIHKVYKIK